LSANPKKLTEAHHYKLHWLQLRNAWGNGHDRTETELSNMKR